MCQSWSWCLTEMHPTCSETKNQFYFCHDNKSAIRKKKRKEKRSFWKSILCNLYLCNPCNSGPVYFDSGFGVTYRTMIQLHDPIWHTDKQRSLVWLTKDQVLMNTLTSGCEESDLGVKFPTVRNARQDSYLKCSTLKHRSFNSEFRET